jgi:hypothetical protein
MIMKTKIILSLAIALTAALLSQPMFADITYSYTGNPFTSVTGPPYTTSDRVTGTVTLASPLGINLPFGTTVTPLAFSFSDGVQTITNLNANPGSIFEFGTGPTGAITGWGIAVDTGAVLPPDSIGTFLNPFSPQGAFDRGHLAGFSTPTGQVSDNPGVWTTVSAVSDTGSTLALLFLSLTALGVATRPLKRAAA